MSNKSGAIFIFGVQEMSVEISGTELRQCSAATGGGGIACSEFQANPSLTVSYLTITDCSADSSYGQAIHIYSCSSFTWDHLCITGTGTLVKSDISISVPTGEQLTEGCPTHEFIEGPSHYSLLHRRVLTNLLYQYTSVL